MDSFYTKYSAKLKEGSTIGENQDCIIWTKAKNSCGYGVIKYKSPSDFSWKTVNVHRLSFVVFNKKMFADVKNYDVSHLCNNKLCIKKEHLYAETRAQNRKREICVNRNICNGHFQRPAVCYI